MIVIAAPPAEESLAWAKATRGMGLSPAQRKIVALHLAERVHNGGEDCLTGQERRVLADIAAGPDVAGRFELLVAAYADWREVETNVDGWRHQVDPPMGRDEAVDYVNEHLADAVAGLIVEPSAVSA